MGEVPDSLPVTEETRERLREQANQLGEPTVLRLFDLLAVAVDDMRQGGDPRLPLELALVKVTRPAADLSRESIAFRLEQLESAWPQPAMRQRAAAPRRRARRAGTRRPTPSARGRPPSRRRSSSSSSRRRGSARSSRRSRSGRSRRRRSSREARPAELEATRSRSSSRPSADFHRKLAEEPKNATLLARRALRGDRPPARARVRRRRGAATPRSEPTTGPAGEEEIFELLKDTFDAESETWSEPR